MSGPLLILTALRYEGVAVAKQLGLRFSSPAAASGTAAAGGQIELRVVGPRCGGLSALAEASACRGIIMAGLAGALDPALGVGDVVVDRRSSLPVPAGAWRRGDIHTAAEIVDTVEKKSALYGETGALVVDMENAIARAFAAEQGIPFLGVRAVSDRADEPLDPATLRWVDPAGMVRPARLAADLCRRPGRIPELVRLGRRSSAAVRYLAYVLREMVSARPLSPVLGGEG